MILATLMHSKNMYSRAKYLPLISTFFVFVKKKTTSKHMCGIWNGKRKKIHVRSSTFQHAYI